MALKKSLMIAGAVASIGLAGGAAGVKAVSAESDGSNTLADKIAQKFNLNKDEVQKVFEENHAEKEAEHQTEIEDRLTTAVKDGKLTEDQKTKILAKLEEMRNSRPTPEEFDGKAEEGRREFKVEKHDELEQWAKDNNIPMEYLHPGGPGKRIMHKF